MMEKKKKNDIYKIEQIKKNKKLLLDDFSLIMNPPLQFFSLNRFILRYVKKTSGS